MDELSSKFSDWKFWIVSTHYIGQLKSQTTNLLIEMYLFIGDVLVTSRQIFIYLFIYWWHIYYVTSGHIKFIELLPMVRSY